MDNPNVLPVGRQGRNLPGITVKDIDKFFAGIALLFVLAQHMGLILGPHAGSDDACQRLGHCGTADAEPTVDGVHTVGEGVPVVRRPPSQMASSFPLQRLCE